MALWLSLLVLALAASPAAAATASLEPASGPAGATSSVRAAGLEPHETVEMRVGGGAVAVLTADGRGRLRHPVRIPAEAPRKVRVALRSGEGHVTFTYRIASRFSGTRTAHSSDWLGHNLRLRTHLKKGLLVARVRVAGLREASRVAVEHDGRRVARAAGRPGAKTRIRLKLPGHAAGRRLRVRARGVRLSGRLQVPPAVLAAVGDIACKPDAPRTKKLCRHADTAKLATKWDADAAALLGDIQYENGELSAFRASFHPTWGQLQMPLRPVPGNHEYRVDGARDYFDYFAQQARWRPPSWYSYNLGPWHVVALNSNCEHDGVGCEAGSLQEQWLRADLAASPHRCTIAYWHHPRYSSGFHGSDPRTQPFFKTLREADAELVLAGHDHDYERFAPQDANGQADPDGIRSFVVGTGGKNTTALRQPRAPHSQLGRDDAHGVLILRLYEDSYSWRFVRIDGKVLDFGNGSCR